MIVVDTNILVYAHHQESEFHPQSFRLIKELAESDAPWGICFHCLVEFYAITTHPKLWKRPSLPEEAATQMNVWRESPTLRILMDSEDSLDRFIEVTVHGSVRDGQAHDARIAACCLTHSIKELWTVDRDFSRYPNLKTKNPLLSGQ